MTDEMLLAINLVKLLGGDVVQSAKTGNWAYVLNLGASRALFKPGKQMDRSPEVWVQLRAAPSEKLHGEQTHYVTESLSREDYQRGERSSILGNARLYK